MVSSGMVMSAFRSMLKCSPFSQGKPGSYFLALNILKRSVHVTTKCRAAPGLYCLSSLGSISKAVAGYPECRLTAAQ